MKMKTYKISESDCMKLRNFVPFCIVILKMTFTTASNCLEVRNVNRHIDKKRDTFSNLQIVYIFFEFP